jgi:chromosome segregation ATPase
MTTATPSPSPVPDDAPCLTTSSLPEHDGDPSLTTSPPPGHDGDLSFDVVVSKSEYDNLIQTKLKQGEMELELANTLQLLESSQEKSNEQEAELNGLHQHIVTLEGRLEQLARDLESADASKKAEVNELGQHIVTLKGRLEQQARDLELAKSSRKIAFDTFGRLTRAAASATSAQKTIALREAIDKLFWALEEEKGRSAGFESLSAEREEAIQQLQQQLQIKKEETQRLLQQLQIKEEETQRLHQQLRIKEEKIRQLHQQFQIKEEKI